MAKSLNKVQLIGNLTRDPELKYTPSGAAICRFGIATNRQWTTESGEKREEADFHNIVAWRKLGEICSQYLVKGKKVYVEGRLSTQSWTAQDGQQKTRTEVVIDDMIMLDGSRGGTAGETAPKPVQAKPAPKKRAENQTSGEDEGEPRGAQIPAGNKEEEVSPDDIPF